jgi:hypothetical protein
MAGAETGHALGDFQALDPPLEGHTLGRAPGQRNGAGVVLPGRGVAAGPPFQVSPGRPVEGVPGQLRLAGQGDQLAAARVDAVAFGQGQRAVAGVPVRRYRPEKRLVILADQTGMRCDDARNSPPGWQRLPDGRPEAVGAALIAWMERLEPSWPTAASATVAYNGATVNRSFRQARGDSPGGGCPGMLE